MNISCGSTAEKELPAFLDRYENLKQRWEDERVTDLDLNFFQNGMDSFPCMFTSTSPIHPYLHSHIQFRS